MATMRCKCGTVLRDDDPDFSYRMLSWRQFDVDLESDDLFGVATSVWGCRTCHRLWVFWDPLGEPTEFVPQPGKTD